MSRNESRSNQALGRREPRHPDDVLPQDAGQKQSSANGQPKRGANGEVPQGPPDAVPGREYQGSGVMNEHGRFGSSTRPQDLTSSDERTRGERKR